MSATKALPADLAQALGNALAPQRPPLLPELELWLIAGHVDLNARCEALVRGDYAPYWAVCWGAGQALARYVLDRPELVRGKTVVDFGAGSAVVGLAAALSGARRVVAVDTDPRARRIAMENARLNGLGLEVSEVAPKDCALILAADVLYDVEGTRYLVDAAAAGHEILVADPHRTGAARLSGDPLLAIASQALPDVDYPIGTAFIHRMGPDACAVEGRYP